jgi:AcrR family transcriptional regulator
MLQCFAVGGGNGNGAVTTKAKQAAETREKLIQAAIALFAERGYRNSSVQAIGEAAGVSRGLVNFHFGSKDALLSAVVERVVSDWETQTLIPYVGERTGIEALRAALEAHRLALTEMPDMLRVYYGLMFEALGPGGALAPEFAHLHREIRTLARGWVAAGIEAGEIRSDVDPDAVVIAVIGALRGIAYQWLIEREGMDLDRVYAQLEEMIERGLR